MAKKLHHRSKRYEVQVYNPKVIAWRPAAYYDEETKVMQVVNRRTKAGEAVRVLDRYAGRVVMSVTKKYANAPK